MEKKIEFYVKLLNFLLYTRGLPDRKMEKLVSLGKEAGPSLPYFTKRTILAMKKGKLHKRPDRYVTIWRGVQSGVMVDTDISEHAWLRASYGILETYHHGAIRFGGTFIPRVWSFTV